MRDQNYYITIPRARTRNRNFENVCKIMEVGEMTTKKKLCRIRWAIDLTSYDSQGDFALECKIKETRMSDIICRRVKVKNHEKAIIEDMLSKELGKNWREKIGGDIWEAC